jgi:hypothetical protein
MTPILARIARGRQLVRCWVGVHEFTTVAQEALAASQDAPGQPGGLRQRCLHCGHLTDGWLADGPRYTVTQAADRARLVLHNPRLKRCPCASCEAARAARRAKRGRVTQMRRTA